ncbi:MAG: AraC family transcriptional regulator [Alphaproteobacteria bacterium]|nr:AraC family transcriptional regulator [Alphaproteobacteria bacterium]
MPLARSSLLPVIVELAEKHGVAAADLFDDLDLDPSQFSHPTTVIESSALIDAVAYAARASGRRDFGLKVATSDDPRALAPIGFLANHCGTTAEALAITTRHLSTHNRALEYSFLAEGPNYVCRLRLAAQGKYPSAQYIEMCLGLCARLCTLFVGDAWRPETVLFEHDREADPAAYHRAFRAPVRFGQEMNAVVMRRADLDQPIDRDNPAIQDLLKALAEIQERESREDIVVRLGPVLRSLLAVDGAAAARAAKLLGLSPRTLQRRLAERGTTFQQVLDDVRLSLVREHLPRPGMTLAELAPILGFSEASAVSRFLRATGGFKHHKKKDGPALPAAE